MRKPFLFFILLLIGALIAVGAYFFHFSPNAEFYFDSFVERIGFKSQAGVGFNVSTSGGNLVFSRGPYSVTLQPLFRLSNGSTLTWAQIPENINKTLWKTNIEGEVYTYGVKFSNLTDGQKNNFQNVVLHRVNSTGLTASDVRIEGKNMIIKDKIILNHNELLRKYTIPIINKTDIVIGNLSNGFESEGNNSWSITFEHMSSYLITVDSAYHLWENKSIKEDIFSSVEHKDNVWSPTINENEYVRITFERAVGRNNDITIYARNATPTPGYVEVYEKNQSTVIATFQNITEPGFDTIFLTNLENESNMDGFDLKVLGGGIQFDYIVDPKVPANDSQVVWRCGELNHSGSYFMNQSILNSADKACINITTSNVELDMAGYTIDGVDSGTISGISISIVDALPPVEARIDNVTVKDGTIAQFYNGILISANSNSTYHNITFNEINYRAVDANTLDMSNFSNLRVFDDIGYSAIYFSSAHNNSVNMLNMTDLNFVTGGIVIGGSHWNNFSNINFTNTVVGHGFLFFSNPNHNIISNMVSTSNSVDIETDGDNNVVHSSTLKVLDVDATASFLFYNNILDTTNGWSGNTVTNTGHEFNTTISCGAGTNIIGGPCIGGNYWHDYGGFDKGGDSGIGNDLGHTITNTVFDYAPLVNATNNNTGIAGCVTFRKAGTYNMSGNITNHKEACMVSHLSYSVENDIILDGKGYVIDGTDNPSAKFGWEATGNNMTIKNVTFTDWSNAAMRFASSQNIRIEDATFFSNTNGLSTTTGSSKFNISRSNFSQSTLDGISFTSSITYVVIANSSFSNMPATRTAIGGGTNNLFNITGSNFTNNGHGIDGISNRWWVYGNRFVDNIDAGIQLSSSVTGTNYAYNNFFNNTNAGVDGNNFPEGNALWWNVTKDCTAGPNIIGGDCIAGNYWEGHNGTDNDFDGVGDVPFDINGTVNPVGDLDWGILMFPSAQPEVTQFNFVPLNSSKEPIGGHEYFNSTFLEEIEFMNITFHLFDAQNITGNVTIFYTANGTNACATGNKQSTECYAFDRWIKFQNGTETGTFKDEGASGDFINCAYTGNSTDRNYTCMIDEHYNPNVFKWYDAGYNFSNVKWQDGTNQRITQNRQIMVILNESIIPTNADQYKLDFRANNTGVGLSPLEAYACNSSYVTGDIQVSQNCALVGSRTVNQMQDDGTKFRAIFTKQLLDGLNEIKSIVLRTNTNNPSNYWYIKTYNVTTPAWETKWNFSTNNGNTWTNLGDGYESEMNVNWFNDGGVDPTTILFKIESNNTGGIPVNSSTFNMTWNINPQQNYAPLVDIIHPNASVNVTAEFQVNFTVAEPNGDDYLTNISMSNGSRIAIATNMSLGNFSAWFDSTGYFGQWNLTVHSCEVNTSFKLCGNDTILINITKVDLIPPTFTVIPANATIEYSDRWAGVFFTATDDVKFANYSVNDSTFLINSSGFLNVTTNFSLRASPWIINVSVNDTGGNYNQTTYLLNITNKTAYLAVEGTTPIFVGASASFSGTGCPAVLTCTFARDGNISIDNPDLSVLAVGDYNYTYNSTGNANYSKLEEFKILTVQNLPSGNATGVATPSCRYERYGFYNLNLPWFRQENCV